MPTGQPDDGVRRVERAQPLYQQVYHVLREGIVTGVYAPGQILAESSLAQALGVSRTPVREALRQLEKDGLVVTGPYEVVVAKPSEQDFVDLYVCRAALERVVAEYAAQRRSDADVAAMTAALDDAERAIDSQDHAGVLRANTRFHDRMVESAGIPRLRELMGSIRGPILLARRHVLAQGEQFEREILGEHRAILAAIVARSPRVAVERMERHMRHDIERGLAQFRALAARADDAAPS
ncbi:MAG: GntR family transcriptional regulator [Actinomycetia bacterium]|jgi:DNA-binding GntR family transcriptional regulator|nr:GntR family transcriptional regulator [Actinomycetes bacterium]